MTYSDPWTLPSEYSWDHKVISPYSFARNEVGSFMCIAGGEKRPLK